MEKKKGIKQFVKGHKKDIFTGLSMAAIGVGGYLLGSKIQSLGGIHHFIPTKDGNIMMPGFNIEGGLTIADLGRLGEEYIKHDPELTMSTKVLEVGHIRFE